MGYWEQVANDNAKHRRTLRGRVLEWLLLLALAPVALLPFVGAIVTLWRLLRPLFTP